MGAHVRAVLIGSVLTLGVLHAACGGSAVTPDTLRTEELPDVPSENASVTQNDATTGCSLLPGADATRGYGFTINFEWGPPPLPGGQFAGYELYATNADDPTPIIDTFTPYNSYPFTSCNAFVGDSHLQGWQWRVRAKNTRDEAGAWSTWFTFQFKPCRLSDGTPCRAPN